MSSIRAILPITLLLLSSGIAMGQGCFVTQAAISFGIYDSGSTSPLNSLGEIVVTCNGNLGYTLTLGAGQNSGGSFSPRKMALNGDTLDYSLYIDPARTQVWGDGTGTTYVQTVTPRVIDPILFPPGTGVGKKGSADRKLNLGGGGRKDKFTVYGRVREMQGVPAGNYTDILTITVNF